MSDYIITGASVIVRDENNRILLGLRKGGWKPGTWGFPGGKVDKGELLIDGALRELFEETSLERRFREHLKYFTFTEDIVDDYHFITHYFILKKKLLGGLISPREPNKCEEWRFFTREGMPNNLFDPVRNLLIKKDCEAIWDGTI